MELIYIPTGVKVTTATDEAADALIASGNYAKAEAKKPAKKTKKE